MRVRDYVLAITVGIGIGIFLLHPLTLVISEFFHWHNGYWHFHWYEIPGTLKTAYSIEHLPMTFVYGGLSAAVGYLWVTSNSTYRRLAEQSRRFALIGREASTIVHDINNPLFGITVFVELIREGLDDTEKLDYCSRVESSVGRISGLIAEIGTLAAGEGRIAIRKQPTPLDELAERIAKELHLSAKLEIDAGARRELSLDPLYFGRVLMNLFRNADDALRHRTDGFIRLSVRPYKNRDTIEIADNGPGIPGPIRKLLFGFGVTHGKTHGSGLGLYAARRIVEAHGGTISFRDRAGGGTVFTISLPEQ